MLPLTIISSLLVSRSFSSDANEDIGSGDGIEYGTPRALNAVKSKSQLWPNKTVYYDDRIFSARYKSFIKKQLNHITQKTGNCVRFQSRNKGHRVNMRNISDKGCSAIVGYSRTQNMNLARGCMNPGTVQHEFLHSLGIWHSQSRSDRDDYVEIMMREIIAEKRSPNFNKLPNSQATHFQLPYDYDSVMHYHARAFTKRGKLTITTKDKSKQRKIGQRHGISFGDILLIKSLYSCITKDDCKTYVGKGFCKNEYRDWMDTLCVGQCSNVPVPNPPTNERKPPPKKSGTYNDNCSQFFSQGACSPRSEKRFKLWMNNNCEKKYQCQKPKVSSSRKPKKTVKRTKKNSKTPCECVSKSFCSKNWKECRVHENADCPDKKDKNSNRIRWFSTKALDSCKKGR